MTPREKHHILLSILIPFGLFLLACCIYYIAELHRKSFKRFTSITNGVISDDYILIGSKELRGSVYVFVDTKTLANVYNILPRCQFDPSGWKFLGEYRDLLSDYKTEVFMEGSLMGAFRKALSSSPNCYIFLASMLHSEVDAKVFRRVFPTCCLVRIEFAAGNNIVMMDCNRRYGNWSNRPN